MKVLFYIKLKNKIFAKLVKTNVFFVKTYHLRKNALKKWQKCKNICAIFVKTQNLSCKI